MDATLVDASRELRKRLAGVTTSTTLLLAAPGLRPVLPLVAQLLHGLEDLADRVSLCEARLRQLEGMGGAVEQFRKTMNLS